MNKRTILSNPSYSLQAMHFVDEPASVLECYASGSLGMPVDPFHYTGGGIR
jgi:hypothetical protein